MPDDPHRAVRTSAVRGRVAGARGARRRGVRAVGGAVAVVAAVWAVGALLGGPSTAAPAAGGADPAAAGRVHVLPLAGVVEPDGTRGPVPDDLVGWLQRHPRVTVLGVRRLRGGGWGSGGVDSWHGVRAVSVDYELSAPTATAPPLERVLGVPLLCDAGACTRVRSGVRVRTTFVTAGGPVTAVETRWVPASGDLVGLLPEPLRTAQREAVLGVVRRLAGAPAEP